MSLLATMARGFQASIQSQNMEKAAQVLSRIGQGSSAGSIPLTGGTSASYATLYRTQPWVQTSVNKLARGVSRIPIKAYNSPDTSQERERIREGPLVDLLNNSQGEGERKGLLAESIIGNMAVYGNAIGVPVRPSPMRPPAELLVSNFADWKLVTDRQGRSLAWVWEGDTSDPIAFRPEEIVHFRWWGPGKSMMGSSPLEALRRTLYLEDAAQRTAMASYENGNRPVGMVTYPQVMDPEDIEANRDRIQSVYGGVDNAFKIAMLDGGAKWEAMSHNLVDDDVVNTRKLTREEVAAVYDLPQPVIGILDRATFSNIQEQHWMLYQDTYDPWVTLIEQTLQAALVDREPLFRGAYVEFDLRKILRGNPLAEIDAGVKAAGGPFMTVDEVRARMNLAPMDTDESQTINLPQGAPPPPSGPSGRVLEILRGPDGLMTGVRPVEESPDEN